MMDVKQRIVTLIDELKAHPRVHVVCDFVGEPATDEAIAEIEAKLDAPLDPALKSFYQAFNGVSVCWQSLPDTDEQWIKKYQSDPIWYFEESEGGQIIVEPIEVVFGPRMQEMDRRELAVEEYVEYGDGTLFASGSEHDPEAFFANAYVLAFFFENNCVMINSVVRDDNGCALIVQGDQGLESPTQDGLTFGSWMDLSLKTFGSIKTLRRLYAGWNSVHIPGSLDELVPPPEPTSIVTYRLGDIPNFFSEGIPADAEVRNCYFWIARESAHTAPLFAEFPEPDIEYVQEGLDLSKAVATAASKSRFLAVNLEPDVVYGGNKYGGSFSVGFHTQPGEKTEAWFQDNDYYMVNAGEILGDLVFLKLIDGDGAPIRSVKAGSHTVNAGIDYDHHEILPGIYAFEKDNDMYAHFDLKTGDRSVEVKIKDYSTFDLHELTL